MILNLFLVFTIVALIPSFTFIAELALGTRKHTQKQFPKTRKNCLIIIPAHNEQSVIEKTINSLRNQLGPNDRILVVADNCSDCTAEIATRLKCEVIIRNNGIQRGKGYALDHALRHITEPTPDVAIIIDADCIVSTGTITQLKAACIALSGPVQASYLMTASEQNNPIAKITQFAVYLKNHVRPLGLSRIGGSAPITGSGFAIPYTQLHNLAPSGGDIVEDMKLGLDLLLSGQKVSFLPQARIFSDLPRSTSSITIQHKRWEHGHIKTILNRAPKLLMHALKNLSWKTFITAIDLTIPPFILLFFSNLFLMAITGGWLFLSNDIRPILTVIAIIALQILSLLLINQTLEHQKLNASDFKGLLAFMASKRSIYTSLIRGNISAWTKTGRN